MMKTPKSVLFLLLLMQTFISSGQIQWYQNQDASTPETGGTAAINIQSFTSNSFIASYLWSINGDEYSWKISKTHINGTEQRQFFVDGIAASTELRVGKNNLLYVLKRSFPFGSNAEFTIYKLDSNLIVREQRNISFPNNFNIINLNAFELDNTGNVYVAGDGQYPQGAGFSPASFVIKMDKNLNTKWSKMDMEQTSFTRLHIDKNGTVLVLQDHHTFYPNVKLKKIHQNGNYSHTITIQTDPERYSVFSKLDKHDNLLIYGGKTVGEAAQAVYFLKVSRANGGIIYRKTHFTAAATQLNDLQFDKHDNLFSLVTLYYLDGRQESRISRINADNGKIAWNKSLPYEIDSSSLMKLVINDDDKFYAVGEKRSSTYYSKGFALRMKKNGQMDANFPSPDSVSFYRSHWLMDGIIDRTDRLIAIGNTSDFDTNTYSSTYFRSFAVKFGNNNNNTGCEVNGMPIAEGIPAVSESIKTEQETVITPKLVVYPNPVQNQLVVSNISPAEYDRLTIYNMQGGLILQQPAKSNTVRFDVSGLPDGMYLLVLRSAVTLKETSIKFVVKH